MITEQLKEETSLCGYAIETNILRNNNPEKKQLLNKTIDEFGKGMILPFKQMIQEYMDTNNILVLNQSIQFYIDEMLPKLKEIQELKYDVNYVEYNNDDGKYYLIQYPNSLENGEYWTKSDDKVVKFIKGTKQKNKNKTLKSGINANEASKQKTRKIKPINEVVIEEEEEKEFIPNEEKIPELTIKLKDDISPEAPDYNNPENVPI